MGIGVRAKNGDTRSLSYLYWGWIRHVASEEGVILPQSGTSSDSFSDEQAKILASALRLRADKIRRGAASRDAKMFVRQMDKTLFPSMERAEEGKLDADFDEPDSMDEIAAFFRSSGGVTLTY